MTATTTTLSINDVLPTHYLTEQGAANVNDYLRDNCGFYVTGEMTSTDAREYFTVDNFIAMFGECEFDAEKMAIIADYAAQNLTAN